ncbi:MAG: NAD(P)-binding domain-containing protein [Bacteroidales bacterium]|nr:NAD(P)-binding domain-containing protein [Candidatus Colimorpha onthohippi]
MIGVLGSGSWATQIAHTLSRHNAQPINWWVRETEKVEELQGVPNLNVTNDIAEVVNYSDDIFMVIPSAYVRCSLDPLSANAFAGKNIISATKGFISGDNLTVTSFFNRYYHIDFDRLCVVSGPSHAEEVARGQFTYLTVASRNRRLVGRVRDMLSCEYLRTIYSDDMVGLECAAALKNIYAVASGMCRSLGYGDNLTAVLLANALQEMSIFITAYVRDGRHRDMSNYVYLSDLLATAYSQHSRNRTLGELVGRGYSVKEARLMQKMVAEGYFALHAVESIRSAHDVSMPIAQALYRILYQYADVRKEMQALVQNF